ncbi:hypothetical protein GCM10023093_18080 [Nemorincola caseinilytica]|uniref:EGF-like domain-containing protein n=1 Tax=Nemorincola caseinilytica TaxID=2054315 RepID=A0ABP8NHM2_9BACT
MRTIKQIALSAALTLGAFSAVMYTSCNSDPCKDVVCQNGGTCNEGNCTCATGYEGTNCETASRAKFIKTWTATDVAVSGGTLPTYTAPITEGTTVVDIKIGHFSGNNSSGSSYFVNDVKATVSGNTITIPSQAPDNDNYKVYGTGTYNTADKKITWSYTLEDPTGAKASYTGTWN